jgi:anaerobic selenocysteine-containing dehydrogenase
VKQNISRRDFLKFLGLGTGATALLEGASATPALAGKSRCRACRHDGRQAAHF